jgi:hypothetical protein
MSTIFARVEKPATGMPTAGETPFSLDIFLLGEQKKVSRGAGRSARGPDKIKVNTRGFRPCSHIGPSFNQVSLSDTIQFTGLDQHEKRPVELLAKGAVELESEPVLLLFETGRSRSATE